MSNVVMIYDSSRNTGHHLEYIISLLIAIKSDSSRRSKYYFVLHPDMKGALDNILYDTSSSKIIYIEDHIIAKWGKLGVLVKTISEWKYISLLAYRYRIDKLLFLMLDQYQIALGIYKNILTNVAIEGIFFKPYTRFYINKSKIDSYLKGGVFCIYKWSMLAIMMRNKNVRRIWTLNDANSVERLNKVFKTEKFCYLPDPVKSIGEIKSVDIFRKYGLKPNTKTLMVFGSISPFKNLNNIIISLSRINNIDLTLLIFGSWLSQEYKRDICELKSKYLKESSNLNIIIEDRYFSDEEIEAHMSKVNVVLIPYLDFFYSSGVLGRASAHGIPVIGSKYALSAELIEEYSLGISVDPTRPDEIANAIRDIISGSENISRDGMRNYISERTYGQFVHLLLN